MQPQQQQATVISVPSQPVQYVFPTYVPDTRIYPKFPKKQAYGAGILLIVAAVLSIIFNSVDVAASNSSSGYYNSLWVFGYVGHGFWVGVMCIITGGIGIGAGIHKTRNWINAFNVMCILAAIFAAAQFAIALLGAIVGPLCYYSYYGYNCYPIQATDVAMEALLTALAIIEAAAAIWGSAICCRTTCCCSCCLAEPRPVATITGAQPYNTQVMVISGNQQFQQPAPAMVQGYPNMAYQPGYPGQPVQFTAMPPMYPPQGQIIPAAVQSPPPYANAPQTFQVDAQMMNQQIAGVHASAQAYPAQTGEHTGKIN